MDNLWFQRLNNILYNDEDCLVCPNCQALNPIETLTKYYMNGRKERQFFSLKMLETVVCLECKHEWLPEKVLE